MIDRYGVTAIMGRPVLYAREVYAMRIAETIYRGYQQQQKTENIAAWHADNPELAQLLFEAQQLADE